MCWPAGRWGPTACVDGRLPRGGKEAREEAAFLAGVPAVAPTGLRKEAWMPKRGTHPECSCSCGDVSG
jgi:hypothetical protein